MNDVSGRNVRLVKRKRLRESKKKWECGMVNQTRFQSKKERKERKRDQRAQYSVIKISLIRCPFSFLFLNLSSFSPWFSNYQMNERANINTIYISSCFKEKTNTFQLAIEDCLMKRCLYIHLIWIISHSNSISLFFALFLSILFCFLCQINFFLFLISVLMWREENEYVPTVITHSTSHTQSKS